MIEVILSVKIAPTAGSDSNHIEASKETPPDDQGAVADLITEAERELPESHEPPLKKRKLTAR